MIDHYDLLVKARDAGITPELPHFDFRGKKAGSIPDDKYPFWWATGVVYEHFHTAKTIRAGTTKKLVPEMYVEMHPEDASELGVEDGQWVRVVTRRGSLEARVSTGWKLTHTDSAFFDRAAPHGLSSRLRARPLCTLVTQW